MLGANGIVGVGVVVVVVGAVVIVGQGGELVLKKLDTGASFGKVGLGDMARTDFGVESSKDVIVRLQRDDALGDVVVVVVGVVSVVVMVVHGGQL